MASSQAEVTEIFNCTPEEFFALVADYESYPEFLTEMKDVKILKQTKTSKEMEYTVSVIKTFKYIITAKEKAPSSVEFEFKSGEIFKSMKGSWSIQKSGKSKCEVTYKIEANFGLLVPGAIAKTLVSVNLPAMMKSFHKRVKKIYNK